MKKTERLVFYYDLSISASSRGFEAPKPISVKKAFELMQLVPLNQRVKELSRGNEHLYVSDWEWTGDILVSLSINQTKEYLIQYSLFLKRTSGAPQKNRKRKGKTFPYIW